MDGVAIRNRGPLRGAPGSTHGLVRDTGGWLLSGDTCFRWHICPYRERDRASPGSSCRDGGEGGVHPICGANMLCGRRKDRVCSSEAVRISQRPRCGKNGFAAVGINWVYRAFGASPGGVLIGLGTKAMATAASRDKLYGEGSSGKQRATRRLIGNRRVGDGDGPMFCGCYAGDDGSQWRCGGGTKNCGRSCSIKANGVSSGVPRDAKRGRSVIWARFNSLHDHRK